MRHSTSNWHGIGSRTGFTVFPIAGHLTPVDMRVPGYPAFLAAIFAFFGQSTRAVMLAQAAVDLGDVLPGGTDRGAAGAAIVPATGGAGGIVARGALPFHGKLHGGGSDRNAGHLPHRPGAAGVARSLSSLPRP